MASNLLDEVRQTMRRRHYSIRTEQAYCAWVKRYVRFHKMRNRADLRDGEKKIEAFFSHLATDLHVSPSTQNQAMNALVFLYKLVLKESLDKEINAERAPKRVKLPIVLTREETRQIITLMSGVHQLVVKLLYGSGLRITECLRLRVQDVDFNLKVGIVHSGKGFKDRVTTFPAILTQPLQEHLSRVRLIHEQDLGAGYREVYLPHALARKYPNAAKKL